MKGVDILFFLIRLLGILGLSLGAGSFLFKKHKGIILCKTFQVLSFSAQYFLIGPTAYTAAFLDLISALRNFLFYKFVEKKRSTLPLIIIFSGFVICIGFCSWAGPITLMAVIPKILTTVSYGMKNERILRLITLPSCFFWIAYNCIVGSYEAAIGDFLTLGSLLIAIYRFDIRKPKEN